MKKCIESLDDWTRVTLKEMENKVGKYPSISDLIGNYCRDLKEGIIKLYIADAGMIAKVILDKNQSKNDRGIIFAKILVPKCNPSLLVEDYICDDIAYKSDCVDDVYAFNIEATENMIYTDMAYNVKKQIVKDYYESNKYTFLRITRDYKTRIIYFDFDNLDAKCAYIDKPASYFELLKKMHDKILISKEENGIYYIGQDDLSSEPIVYFAKFRYDNISGDDYFNTLYYTVDDQLNKTLLPIDKTPIILDTMEMAVLFSQSIDLTKSLVIEHTDPFNISLKDGKVKDSAYRLGITEHCDSLLFKLRQDLPKDNSHYRHTNFDIVPVYSYGDITDFVLLYACDGKWIYDESDKQDILSAVNVIDSFKDFAKRCRYHRRKKVMGFNQFVSYISIVKTEGKSVIKKAIDSVNHYSDIVLDYADSEQVSMWYQSYVDDSYYNINFIFSDVDEITDISVYWYDDNCTNSRFLGYPSRANTAPIPKSFIKYVKEICSNYFIE